jgi:hypothetical protein
MNDTLIKLTRPTIKKLLKLYLSPDFESNLSFIKEAEKQCGISKEESHLIWQVFDVGYCHWFRIKDEN